MQKTREIRLDWSWGAESFEKQLAGQGLRFKEGASAGLYEGVRPMLLDMTGHGWLTEKERDGVIARVMQKLIEDTEAA